MHTELLVAIFDHPSLSREAIKQAIFWHPEFARCLGLTTVFDRISEDTVEARLLELSDFGTLVDASCHALEADLLKQAMPRRARWKILETPYGQKIPVSPLNDEFVSFLDVMFMMRTSAIFFVPPAPEFQTMFIDCTTPTAALVMRTAMPDQDMLALRQCLTSTRKSGGHIPQPQGGRALAQSNPR